MAELTLVLLTLLQVFFLAIPDTDGSPSSSSSSLDSFLKAKKRCAHTHRFNSLGDYGYLVSPGYPKSFPSHKTCSYKIHSPPGTELLLNCEEFHLQSSPKCQDERLSVSGTGKEKDSVPYCDHAPFSAQTQTNVLLGWFSSGVVDKTEDEGPRRFNCSVTVVEARDHVESSGDKLPVVSQHPAESSGPGCSCGKRNWQGAGVGSKIVGGTNALMGEFPWRCVLYTASMGTFCGCSVISNQWILTAAHCTKAVSSRDEELYVDMGDYDISSMSETNNTVVRVSRIIQNERYAPDSQDFDMSLLQLESPVEYSSMIQPVCLPWDMTSKSFQGAMVTASGWGTTTEGGSESSILQTVELPVLTSEECRKYYGDRITENMICTYHPGQDTCQGDSGSSVDYYDPLTNRYYAIGVVSWGIGCAEKNDPGVYTKVTHFLDWIHRNSGADFCVS